MPPIYFSLRSVQPFAKMSTEDLDGDPNVQIVRGDDEVVGLRLEDPKAVLRLPEIIERLDLNADLVWSKLRGDADALSSRRAATWGGGGR